MKATLLAAVTLIVIAIVLSIPSLGGQAPKEPSPPTVGVLGKLKVAAAVSDGLPDGTMILRGNKRQRVVVIDPEKDMRIVADLMRVTDDRKTDRQTAEIEGNLKFTNADTAVTATKVLVEFNDSQATFTGNVQIVSRAKEPASEPKAKVAAKTTASPDSEPAKASLPSKPRKPTTVLCEQFVFDYEARTGVATGKLNLKQDDRKATAERAVFDDAKNVITLEGMVEMEEMKDGKPRTMRCARIIIDTDAETWTAEDEATVQIDLTYTKRPAKGKGAEGKPVEGKGKPGG